MERWPLERLAGVAALAAAASALLYSITFLAIDDGASNFFLLVGSLLAFPVFVALYGRLRAVDDGYALLALVLGIAGTFGAVTHAGYGVANEINDPGFGLGLPYPSDPRGLTTFGLTGLAVLVFALLARRGGVFDPRLATLGIVFAGLLLLVYLARLIVLESDDPLVTIPAAITGAIATPAWYAWVGRELLRAR